MNQQNTTSNPVTNTNTDFSESEVQAFQAWCADNQDTIHTPQKYHKAQKAFITEKVQSIHAQNPDMPFRLVLMNVLETLPDFLPADNLVKVVKDVVAVWEELKVWSSE